MRFSAFTIAVLASGVLADNLVPVNIARTNCVNSGKCVDNTGAFDASVCCSGICDASDGCLLPAEASTLLTRLSVGDAPFVCRDISFHGIRDDSPVFVHVSGNPTECLCPEDSICVIGDGHSLLRSSRYWIGECEPETSACVPKIQVALPASKTLFKTTALEDTGLGAPCTNSCPPTTDASICATTCTVRTSAGVANIPTPEFGVEVSGVDADRDLGDNNMCIRPPGSVPLGDECLCNSECEGGAMCIVPLTNSLDGADPATTLADLSLTGTCLVLPGDSGCTADCDCPQGSDCVGGDCTFPAGSSEMCMTDNQCTGSAVCTIDTELCAFVGDEDCGADGQCLSGDCISDKCLPVLELAFNTCGQQGGFGPSVAGQCTAVPEYPVDEPDAFVVSTDARMEIQTALDFTVGTAYTGTQRVTLPYTARYRITAAGACSDSDASNPSFGALAVADFDLVAGTVLTIAVGQLPVFETGAPSSAGGATVVMATPPGTATSTALLTPADVLLVAGGAGGQNTADGAAGCGGSLPTDENENGRRTNRATPACLANIVDAVGNGGGGTPRGKGIHQMLGAANGFFGGLHGGNVRQGGFGGGGAAIDTTPTSGGGGGYTGGASAPATGGPPAGGGSFVNLSELPDAPADFSSIFTGVNDDVGDGTMCGGNGEGYARVEVVAPLGMSP